MDSKEAAMAIAQGDFTDQGDFLYRVALYHQNGEDIWIGYPFRKKDLAIEKVERLKDLYPDRKIQIQRFQFDELVMEVGL